MTEAVVVLVTDRVAVAVCVEEMVEVNEEVAAGVESAVGLAVTVAVLEAVPEFVAEEVGTDAVEVAEAVEVIEVDPDEVGELPTLRDAVCVTVPVPEMLAVYEEVMVTVGDWVT